MSKQNHSLIPTLVVCALVTLPLCQRHAGFMLIALAFPLVPWFVYSGWVMETKPIVRCQQLAKAGIWVLGVSIASVTQATMFVAAKKNSEQISAALEEYIEKFGHCPPELNAIGITRSELREKLGYATYTCESGRPTLFYGSTFVPFEKESYDFSRHSWVHVYD